MNGLIYWFGRAWIAALQTLPLAWVARLGRLAGTLAFCLSRRYRQVAINNLTLCFGDEKSPAEIRALALENFRRVGENFLAAFKTAALSFGELKPHLEFTGAEKLPRATPGSPNQSVVVAIGHFGNFELFARVQDVRPDFQAATTYRAFKQPAVNRLMQYFRGLSGCLFFERRLEGRQLRDQMGHRRLLLGLLADQSSQGMRGPFLGHDCHTGLAPAILALRYHCPLHTAICYRTRLAQWRIEIGEAIPTHQDGHPRPSEDIMREVNRVLETAVRRDPANWFWGHRRWKN
jgi:KDO2-lipid IV(A) lauroyltransferase